MGFSTARLRSFALTLVSVWLLAAGSVVPARAVEVEPYAFAGWRDGDVSFGTGIACVAITGQRCPVSASTEDGSDEAWGIGTAVGLSGPWWLDVRLSRQDTDVRYFDVYDAPVPRSRRSFEITQLHAGVLYRFFEGPWSPFVTAFGGVARVESPASTPQRSEIDLNRTSGGVGVGALIDLGAKAGLRLEVRGIRTDLPGDLGGDLDQLEGSAGFRLRL